jgi:hypothetical protein
LIRKQLIQKFYKNPENTEIIFDGLQKEFGIQKASSFFGAEYFIGKFDHNNKPLEGNFIFANNIHIKIHPHKSKEGFLYAEQLDPENNSIQKIIFRWGEGLELEDLEILEKEQLVVDNITTPTVRQSPEVLRSNVSKPFSTLKVQHQTLVPKELSAKLTSLKEELGKRPLQISATMLAEFGFRISGESESAYHGVDDQISKMREAGIEDLLDSDFGNCREFACKTLRSAKALDMEAAFVIAACPNHIFNLVVDDGKIYMVDSWHGNLLVEFTPDNFYRHASLHGLSNFRIFDRATYQGERKDFGVYHRDELSAARDLVEERILEVKKAAFDDKYHQIIEDRIAQKISDLNPGDAYYHENARELLYLIDYYDLDIGLKEQMKEEYIGQYDPDGFIIGTEAETIYDLFCRDAENPANEFESITARIITKFPQIITAGQKQLEYSFSRYTKGLDPNSQLIIDYLNSSYSKGGWANIDKEIGSFAEIINDPSRPNHERVDAEGYYAICKFKIAGHLHGLEPNERRQELERLSPVLTEHFGLSGDISFEQVLEHTESYARGIMAKQQGEFKTAAEAGRLCQVAAIVMQMPRIGGKCDDFAEVAEVALIYLQLMIGYKILIFHIKMLSDI